MKPPGDGSVSSLLQTDYCLLLGLVLSKLQALVYDILPPTTAISGYAIGARMAVSY